VGSIPDEVTGFFFPIYVILLAVLRPGVYSASNRNEYQKLKKMFLGSRLRPSIGLRTCEPIILAFLNP
jgi:hypothetical protein